MPNSCWFLVSPLIDLYYLNPYWFITLQHTYKHTYAQTTNMWTFWNNVCTSLFCTEMSLRTLLQTSWFTSDSFQNEAQKWPCQRFYRATRPRWRRWVLCTEEVCGGGIDHPQTLLITGRRAIYPSSNKTLTLTSYLWQNDGLGEGWVGRLEDPWIFGWVSKRFLKPLPREIFDLPQRLNPSIFWSALHCWSFSTPRCDSFSLLFVQVVLARFIFPVEIKSALLSVRGRISETLTTVEEQNRHEKGV